MLWQSPSSLLYPFIMLNDTMQDIMSMELQNAAVSAHTVSCIL